MERGRPGLSVVDHETSSPAGHPAVSEHRGQRDHAVRAQGAQSRSHKGPGRAPPFLTANLDAGGQGSKASDAWRAGVSGLASGARRV